MKPNIHGRKLKNFLINKDLQFRIILHSLLYVVLAVFITIFIILYPLIHEIVFSQDPEVRYRAAQTFISLGYRLLPAFLVVLFLMFIHLILLTHRIFGPIVNFSHTFRRLAVGDMTRKVYLRKKDLLIRESHLVNEMTDAIAELIHRAVIDTDTLIHSLDNFKPVTGDPDSQATVDKAISIIKDQATAVKSDLSAFKLL